MSLCRTHQLGAGRNLQGKRWRPIPGCPMCDAKLKADPTLIHAPTVAELSGVGRAKTKWIDWDAVKAGRAKAKVVTPEGLRKDFR